MSGTKFLTYDIPWHIFWHSISDEGERQNETTGEKLMRRRCIGQQNNKVDTPPNAYPNFRYTILHGSAWCKSKFFRWSGTMTKKTLYTLVLGAFLAFFPNLANSMERGMPCLVLYAEGPCHLPKRISIICLARTLTNDGNAWQAHDKRMKHGSTWQTLHDKPWQNHE